MFRALGDKQNVKPMPRLAELRQQILAEKISHHSPCKRGCSA